MTNTTTAPRNRKETVAGEAAKLAEQARDQVADAVSAGEEALDTALAKGSDEVKRLAETSNRFVRENPGIALAGAMGMGLLIGLALRGRD